jgi:hypothetical protein
MTFKPFYLHLMASFKNRGSESRDDAEVRDEDDLKDAAESFADTVKELIQCHGPDGELTSISILRTSLP